MTMGGFCIFTGVFMVARGLLGCAPSCAANDAATWSFGVGHRATFPETISILRGRIVVNLPVLPERVEVSQSGAAAATLSQTRPTISRTQAAETNLIVFIVSPRDIP